MRPRSLRDRFAVRGRVRFLRRGPNGRTAVREQPLVVRIFFSHDRTSNAGPDDSPGDPDAGKLAITLDGNRWTVVTSASIGALDHNLAAVSAAAPKDAWAVGSFLPPSGDGTVLRTLGVNEPSRPSAPDANLRLHWNSG
jgi:hypothetical protein